MIEGDKEDEDVSPPDNRKCSGQGLKSGAGKALLGPAAKVFGDYLGWRAKEITDGWKEQREKNLETHADKVRD